MRPTMLCPALTIFLVLSIVCFTVNANKKKADKKAPEWKADSRPSRNEFEENKHEGTDAELSCPAKGQPKPTVEWFKDGDPFFPRAERIELKKGVLHFQDLKISDKGNYTCVVNNEIGRLEFTYVLDVIEKVWPLNVVGPNNLTVYEGQDAEFFCRATNDPRARITWLKKPNEIELTGNPRPAYLQGVPGTPEVLLIQNVTHSDVGQYTCMAGNYYGSKYQDAWLVVLPRTTTTTTTTTTMKPTTTSAATTTTTTAKRTTTTTISSTTTTTRQPSVTEKIKKKDKDRKKKKERKDKKKKKEKKNRIKEPENVIPEERYNEDRTSDLDHSYHMFPDTGKTNDNTLLYMLIT
ncbi:hypothetical protein ACJMK2_024309 [Sinanodonta woodiana]|uniref:receptor protein-tyrosine kinase n=1 Tax=Sinanodonta woodiana TaxID=1069815 RepID=A0ABD3T6Z8_SINWO